MTDNSDSIPDEKQALINYHAKKPFCLTRLTASWFKAEKEGVTGSTHENIRTIIDEELADV